MPHIGKVTSDRYALTLPQEMMDEVGLQKGDHYQAEVIGKQIIVEKLVLPEVKKPKKLKKGGGRRG